MKSKTIHKVYEVKDEEGGLVATFEEEEWLEALHLGKRLYEESGRVYRVNIVETMVKVTELAEFNVEGERINTLASL